jgi:predicted outer membrane protein
MVKVVSPLIPSLMTILALTKDVFAQNNAVNCILQLPTNPLTAKGLATPFILVKGDCDQTNPNHQVFVEATIFDPNTKTFGVYHPLVINEGAQPAIKPVVPTLPQDAVVGLWVKAKANSITLTGSTQTCMNASCNTHAFFSAVQAANEGQGVDIPPVGNDKMGRPCPTARFFDALTQISYLESNEGQFAQATKANRNALKQFAEISGGSDNVRKSAFLALGCTPLQAPSMMEHGVMLSSMALNELFNNQPLLNKANTYHRGGRKRRTRGNFGKRSSHLRGSGVDCLAIANTPPTAGNFDNITMNTKFGPLSPVDRELVRKVRLATLWELPMAREATQRAELGKVKRISATIEAQHVFLDAAVDGVVQQMAMDMPTEPNTLQKCFIADIQAQSGIDYDTTFVKWLRFAHGQVFESIATARATSQNTVIRSFAETANTFVLGHMQLLESTGLTQNSSFPALPPVPAPPPVKRPSSSTEPPAQPPKATTVLVV